MEQYFFKITASFMSKNRLQEEFLKYINSLDCTLIKDKPAMDSFVRMIKAALKELNGKHSRCQPVHLSEYQYGGHGLTVPGLWSASFYKVEITVELKDGFLQTFIT